jgi:hypothetical protein
MHFLQDRVRVGNMVEHVAAYDKCPSENILNPYKVVT